MANPSNIADEERTLAYDLRQRYAKIVADHLEVTAIYRRERDYSNYFRSLDDLHTIVSHKFKSADNTEFKKLRNNAISIANEHSEAWLGNSSDSKEIAKIEESLRAIERLLYKVMDENKMFGTGYEDEGGL